MAGVSAVEACSLASPLSERPIIVRSHPEARCAPMSSLVIVGRSWSQFVNAAGRPNAANCRLCRSCAG